MDRLELEERGEKLCQGREGGGRKPKEKPVNSSLDWVLSNGAALFLPSAGCRLQKTHPTHEGSLTASRPMKMTHSAGREGPWNVTPCCNPIVSSKAAAERELRLT